MHLGLELGLTLDRGFTGGLPLGLSRLPDALKIFLLGIEFGSQRTRIMLEGADVSFELILAQGGVLGLGLGLSASGLQLGFTLAEGPCSGCDSAFQIAYFFGHRLVLRGGLRGLVGGLLTRCLQFLARALKFGGVLNGLSSQGIDLLLEVLLARAGAVVRFGGLALVGLERGGGFADAGLLCFARGLQLGNACGEGCLLGLGIGA